MIIINLLVIIFNVNGDELTSTLSPKLSLIKPHLHSFSWLSNRQPLILQTLTLRLQPPSTPLPQYLNQHHLECQHHKIPPRTRPRPPAKGEQLSQLAVLKNAVFWHYRVFKGGGVVGWAAWRGWGGGRLGGLGFGGEVAPA